VEQVDVFSLVGSRFQALGAATEKALSPSLRCVRGTAIQFLMTFFICFATEQKTDFAGIFSILDAVTFVLFCCEIQVDA